MVAKDIFEEEILIPKARIAVLIGEKGTVRRAIEKEGKVKLEIKTKENLVKIVAKDAFDLWIARQVIEAIGRGFNPEIAQKIFKENNSYELINLQDFGAKSQKDLQRLRGLVIGAGGRTKNIIQKYTNTDVSVYGKTIGIIGPTDGVQLARQAIEMLLTGARHGTAYRFLEQQIKKPKE